MRVCQAMNPCTPMTAPARRPFRARFGIGALPSLNPVLAFWALWHCRHARPPDTRLAA
ncbi:hypothetical protein [Pseudomonas sp. ML96]|uniref:hypothetical protein n=1 Tax=Pseudomonas sp. ML96 TaxID=1523503 RepID=UPI0012E0ADB8|nr:hypothetical protein [Pseudomonas sp. ML96]